VPGRIVLFDQPQSPWTIPRNLNAATVHRLNTAGAVVQSVAGGLQTSVWWPGTTLRDFMLFDVLMHEVGHHLLQHHKGKRLVRIARTADQEAVADAFARRCRRLWEERKRA
jgi:hypothetical protein